MDNIIHYELLKKEIFNRIFDETHLKRMDLITLFYLNEINEEEVYVRKLRRLMFEPSSSELTGALKSLEELKYFNKVRDPQDERSIILKNINYEAINKTLNKCKSITYENLNKVEETSK
ncbi:transcriptional regulator, SarA/Rot family [Mammaliicoccus sciuri]|uniref:transcriptional regulator, SarA/Rot family n=1 Tax=Mammaliicoccus sciuri TaxID=1296 RepID=UPI00065B6232|nr:MarR family transcriptional regulator [Mammaliicoccus sciuri]MBO1219430.1 MarR family transcriptional regulator [Mammaliicoccus sciuri]MBO1233099.1 MarR family transcriptional regulator [Mammaliicoccus sciuri]PNY96827.1 MarR family transcriptional regulator [Mammaliicoccus sciuri]QDR65752.1 MarR family transcriptional regulator [Mammaliicoccus sciuri]RIN84242.1 MarR family transcriptional regulator [Mammaliicoccus sciuri]